MSNVLTQDEVREALAPISSGRLDRVVHEPRTAVITAGETLAFRPGGGRRALPLSKQGLDSLTNFTGVPATMGKNLTAPTLNTVMTELLNKKGTYSVLSREGEVVAFGSAATGGVIPVNRLLSTLERTMGPNVEYTRAVPLGPDSAMVEAVGHRSEAVIRDDLVRSGVVVQFSPVGSIHPTIQSFAVRQWCMNGATSEHVLASYRGGEGDDLWQWFRESVRNAVRSLARIIAQYRRLAEIPVSPEERAAILEGLLKQAGIRGDVAEAVRTRAIETPPNNLYDVFNMVTYSTTHDLREPRQVLRARQATQNFAMTPVPTRVCPVCHESRGARHTHEA